MWCAKAARLYVANSRHPFQSPMPLPITRRSQPARITRHIATMREQSLQRRFGQSQHRPLYVQRQSQALGHGSHTSHTLTLYIFTY